MAWLSRILAPVDFSPRCKGAARYAAALTRHFRAELFLLHAVPPAMTPFASPESTAYPTLGEWNYDRLKQRRNDLAAVLDGRNGDFTVTHEAIVGDAAQTIVSYAREQSADVIVMATHGYGPLRRFLLGSVTAKVLHDSHCPVWTGPHLDAPANPGQVRIRRILCAIDLTASSPAALQWAEDLSTAYGAGLAVIHIVPGSAVRLGNVYADPEWRVEIGRTGLEQSPKASQGQRTGSDPVVESGESLSTTADLARQWGADLMVIGRGGETGVLGKLRTNAYDVLRESPCPVVVV